MRPLTRREVAVLLAGACTLPLAGTFAGCRTAGVSSRKSTWVSNGGTMNRSTTGPLSVCLWRADLMFKVAPFIAERLPDVDIEWMVGRNDLAYYLFLNEHGALPDIITSRRFSLHDAKLLRDNLVNVAETEIAASYYSVYLDSYRNDDGSINWLPACGEMDAFLANKDLFDEHGIDLPHDYASFVSACRQFESCGIKGYLSDFSYDYTALEVLQGLSIPQLTSLEGKLWRMDYESDKTDRLDTQVWPGVFERMERFINDMGWEPEVASTRYVDWEEPFKQGKLAITRGTGNDLKALRADGMNGVVLLPYYSADSPDGWMLTYPSMQIAINKAVEQDETRRRNAMRIVEALLSSEGQNLLAEAYSAVPYNRNVDLVRSEELSTVQPLIGANRLYIRLASNEFFSASFEVVGGMIRRELDAAAAYDRFNELLGAHESSEEIVYNMPIEAAYTPSDAQGNESASVVAETLRAACDVQLLFSPFCLCTGPLFRVGYTKKMLEDVLAPNTPLLFFASLTGVQVRTLVRAYVENRGVLLGALNHSTLPVASGFVMKVRRRGEAFELEDIVVDGVSLNDDVVYTFAYVHNRSVACLDLKAVFGGDEGSDSEGGNGDGGDDGGNGDGDFPIDVMTDDGAAAARDVWRDYLLSGGEPKSPVAYLSLSEG